MTKRLAALFCVTSLLAFSATSCGFLEMRDATSEIHSKEETKSPTLQQAEKYSEAETEAETEPETMPVETEPVPEEPKNTVSLALAGGVIVDEAIYADAAARAAEGKNYSFLTMYSAIFPLVQDADMSMVTLHSPAADTDAFGLSDVTHTNMPEESLIALQDLGFDVINVAGTKRFDCMADGLLSTIENVCDTGLYQIGAYRDDIDAGDVRVMEVNGIRVAFVAFTENANSDTDGLVLHDLTDETAAASLITYADLVSDVVVVSVTWDNGTGSAVRSEQKAAAQMLAEAGADIIAGSDGSGLQTAEWLTAEDGYKTFVAYSLGSLLSTGTDAATSLSGMLTLEIAAAEDGITLENVKILPLVKHYEAGSTGYQVSEFFKYSPETAALHGAGETILNDMYTVVYSIIPEAFLPETNG
ncbi:MAG: CapA family protein [Clostridia bacterium]|nr:CapA family protein [Clostridia bacterium]